jgi:hypothetical protein
MIERVDKPNHIILAASNVTEKTNMKQFNMPHQHVSFADKQRL